MLSSFFQAIFSSLEHHFFHFLCFPINNDVYPKHYQGYNKDECQQIRDFIYENYYKQIEFSKEGSYYLWKRLKKERLLLLANKLIKIYMIRIMLKNIMNHF